ESVEVWGRLLSEDPADLEAVFDRARLQAALGDVEAGRLTLASASPESMRVRDLRGTGRALQPSLVFSYQCSFRFHQRRLTEARSLCEKGLSLGSKATSNAYLARIALLEGDLGAADRYSNVAALSGGPGELRIRAIVLRLLGGREADVSGFIAR